MGIIRRIFRNWARRRTLRSWLRAMEHTPGGRLVLSNIVHDCLDGHLHQHVARRFLRSVVQGWEGASPTKAPEGIVRMVVERDHPAYICQGQKEIASARPCSRVMLATDFVRHNINWRMMGWPGPFERIPEQHIARLHEGLVGIATGTMPHRSPRAWVTQTTFLHQIRQAHAPDDVPSAVRDRLGLLHMLGEHPSYDLRQEAQLVEVKYAPSAFVQGGLFPPTFLDAMCALPYRSKRTSDGWGMTVDLRTGEDGLPEAVHRPIPFTSNFSVQYVGRPGGIRSGINFADLPTKAPFPWEYDSYACRMEHLL